MSIFERFNKDGPLLFDAKAEAAERQRLVELMEKTLGYANLNEKQQQYLREALYISQRAERATDEASNSNLQKTPAPMRRQAPEGRPYVYFTGEHEEKAKYQRSQVNVVSNYCSDMPAKLEGYTIQEGSDDSGWIRRRAD